MKNPLWKMIACFIVATGTSFADVPKYGLTFSEPVITKDPQFLHIYRVTGWYQPRSLVWQHTHIYFDASVGHWWVSGSRTPNSSLNIVALAPIIRYYFATNHTLSPFMNISIGLSYLSKTRLEKRNLGMHFAFQDQLGVGATFGEAQKFSATLTAMHYSNGSLCNRNSGITVPLILGVEYAFG